MSSIVLLLILMVYLSLLFFIAHLAEKKSSSKWTNNSYLYSLSLAVYCSAWTYYGSIGVAANSGITFLAIYLGPVIIIPIWLLVLKKIIKISRVNKIASIADFISLRYGNSRVIGALVSMLCIVAILPYISLQLKAISETFHVVTKTPTSKYILDDTTTFVAVILALFSSYYGTRYLDASEKRKGIITVVALESILKLIFFLILGVYVTFYVFDGFEEIYKKASTLPHFNQKNTIGGLPQALNWFFLLLLSSFAIFLLPRQFQVGVIENNRENHINTAIWFFPLYLLVFNFFVFPIAWGGNILFFDNPVNADTYALRIPQFFNEKILTVLVFLGGFSAAISMIIVSTISLSTMLTNNILIPYNLLGKLKNDQTLSRTVIVNARRVSIFLLIIIAYLIYRFYALGYNLVSIGLISFVLIAQLAPSFFGALYWRRGSKKGAIWGIMVGFLICVYTLLLPFTLKNTLQYNSIIENGLFELKFLKPLQLFGLDYLEPIPHALFWSLLANFFTFFAVSVSFKGNYRERNYAEMFVDINKYISNLEDAYIWRGTAYIRDIEKVLNRFLGEDRTKRALTIFNAKYNIDKNSTLADARLIKFAENLLTGHIGSASAKILISSVVKEEKVSLPEVLKILEESKENITLNKKLLETSTELKKITSQLQMANQNLLLKDKQKDDFLDTVTHELRTPITAIRAASEILYEDDEIPSSLKKQFLLNIISESDRLNRLIDKILDLEKFDSGKQTLYITSNNLTSTINKAIDSLQQLIVNKNISLKKQFEIENDVLLYDEDRIIQVVTNLLSNAIKFCPERNGEISIIINEKQDYVEVSICDNGKGIPKEDFETVFEKFYQSNNQVIKKPEGSGLGLSITKKIIQLHKGTIWIQESLKGATIIFTLPKNNSK